MHTRRRQFSRYLSASLFVMLSVIGVLLAPTQLGGATSFVIINGNSMEPVLHRGDLVLVRAADTYEVGDIATYRHPTIGPVIHRIVGRDGARFVFKGDHNDWIDGYRPAAADLVGKYWLFVPGAGNVLATMRQPAMIALLIFGTGLVLMLSTTDEGARRRARLRRYAEELRTPNTARLFAPTQATRAAAHRPAALVIPRSTQEAALFVLVLVVFGALLLALFAFTRPTERLVDEELAYSHTGTFNYTADAPPGVYDAGALRADEPIFRNLVRDVRFDFIYRFESDVPRQIAGTQRLFAEVGADDGWKRTIELQPAAAFTGDTFTAQGRLDLAQVQALVDAKEQQTGVENQHYQVKIVPQIHVNGTLGEQPLNDTFAPALTFRMDALELQIERDTTSDADPLAPIHAATLTRQQLGPNTLGLLGMQFDVVKLRWLAAIAGITALTGALVLGRKLVLGQSIAEPERIRQEYGPLLVAVQDSDFTVEGRVVEVANFGDLARLAEHDERMILYDRCGAEHHYVVQIAGVNYHYRSVELGGKQLARNGL